MTEEKPNSCARCGVPIKPGLVLCNVCAEAAGHRESVVPCLACGATNPASAGTCVTCGAPLHPGVPAAAGGDRDSIGAASPWIIARRAELQVLEDCFDLALERGRVGGAIVSAETGMGVSTLLESFAERLTGRLPLQRIFHVRCQSGEDLFGPLRQIFRQRFETAAETDAMSTRLRFTTEVGRVLGSASAALVTETAHLLGYVSGMPFPNSPVLSALESNLDLLRRRCKEAIVRFFKADLADGPMALVIDGLHKVGPESRMFLMEVFEEIGDAPLVVVVGGRPEVDELSDDPGVVRLQLEPLDDEVMRSLFAAFMPRLVDPPADLVDAIVDRASGNPGSLGELCALLRETGVVDTGTDPWAVDVSKLQASDMPVGLIDTVRARLERLDPRDRSALRHAAVIGEVFWDEAVVALTRQRVRLKDNIGAAQIWADDADGLAISSAIDRLVERQFVVLLPDGDVPGCSKYAFARSGVRDTILAGIDPDELATAHFLTAEWLDHASRDDNARFAEEEGRHWEAAGEARRAAGAYLRAARWARAHYLNQKAIKLFEKVIELTDERDRLVIVDALHDLGSVQELLGQYEAAELYYTEMLRHAWILCHRGKGGAALNKIGRLYRARGDSGAARAFLERAMTLFRAAKDEKGIAACLGDLGELARRQGAYDRAFKLVNQALELQRKMNNRPSIAVSLHSLGHIETARASYSQAERYLEEALEIRRETGDKGGMAQTLSALAIVLFSRGDLEKAIARWEAAQDLAEEVGDRRMLAITRNNLGEAFRDLGQLETSMSHFKACEDVVTTLDDRLLHAEVSRNIGILSHKMGDYESARLQLERSLMLAREVGGRELEGLALRALGEFSAATMWDTSNIGAGDDPAVVHFEQALDIFRAIGSEFEVARTQHAWGNRLLERGDVDGGRQRLEEAKSIFQRIQSKAGDKISRTIEEIIGRTEQPSTKRTGIKRLFDVDLRKKKDKDGIPDLTGELESGED
jgi:predicted ATPase